MIFKCQQVILLLGITSTVLATPQRTDSRAISSSSVSNRERLLDLIDNPPSDVTFDVIDLPLAREFFKDKELVRMLVTCFDITQECPSPGISALIEQFSKSFEAGKGCVECPPEFNRIITFAQNQFLKSYRKEWNRLVQLLSDHLA